MENRLFRDWKESGKKRSENQIIGESGIDILRRLFPQEWVIREYTIDYGIDLDVEFYEKINENVYVTKGEHVLFQVKTTSKLEIKKMKVCNNNSKKDILEYDVVKYSIDTDLISTVERMGNAVPVLLCLVDNVGKEGYFVCLNDYIDKVLIPQNPNYQKQGTVTINIPIENKISSKKFAIEWYGKRAKLYAFFNLINCQKRDLQYISDCNIEQAVESFFKKICRLDIWSVDVLSLFKEKIEYYKEHGSTKQADILINCAIERGENVDEPVYNATYCAGEVSFRHATKIQELHRLWDELCAIADMYESNCREAYIPTCCWTLINEY